MFRWLADLWEGICSIPELLLNGIKSIFVPDTDDMQDKFTSFTSQVSPATMDDGENSLGGLLDVESSEPADISSDYNVGGLNLSDVKFLNLEYFKQGVVYFRPVINGFLTWVLFMFYYNQLLSFLGQAPLMASAVRNAESHRASKESS